MDARPLLTINDMAAKLRVQRSTVYRLINAGELRPIRVGSSYRFTPEWVDEYLAAQAERRYVRWETRDASRNGL
jgi:excisionase family DNA binding protein